MQKQKRRIKSLAYTRFKVDKSIRNCLRCQEKFISVTKTTFMCNSCKKKIENYV